MQDALARGEGAGVGHPVEEQFSNFAAYENHLGRFKKS